MSNNCTNIPENKKQYIEDIGKILVKDYGKKKYYKPEEVKKSHRKSNWYEGLDFSCWSMSVYSSHDDFDTYHQSTGESCDYTEMKAEMLSGISSTDIDILSLSDVNLDASWLDLSAVFEGIGDFFSAIDIS